MDTTNGGRVISTAQVWPNYGAGVAGLWCRCGRTTAQVKPDYGAGVEKGVGPAPQNGVRCVSVAQVPYKKTHLRHNTLSPATIPNATRTKTYFHLRQYLLSPAPKHTFTCSNTYCHLRQSIPPPATIPIVTRAKTYFNLCQYLLPPAPKHTPTCANTYCHLRQTEHLRRRHASWIEVSGA